MTAQPGGVMLAFAGGLIVGVVVVVLGIAWLGRPHHAVDPDESGFDRDNGGEG